MYYDGLDTSLHGLFVLRIILYLWIKNLYFVTVS